MRGWGYEQPQPIPTRWFLLLLAALLLVGSIASQAARPSAIARYESRP